VDPRDTILAAGQSYDAEHLLIATQLVLNLIRPGFSYDYGPAMDRLVFELVPYFGQSNRPKADVDTVTKVFDAAIQLKKDEQSRSEQPIVATGTSLLMPRNEGADLNFGDTQRALRIMHSHFIMRPPAHILHQQINDIQGQGDIAKLIRQERLIDPKRAVDIVLAFDRLQENRKIDLVQQTWRAMGLGELRRRKGTKRTWNAILDAISAWRRIHSQSSQEVALKEFVATLLKHIPADVTVGIGDFPTSERPTELEWSILCDILGYIAERRADQVDPLAVHDYPLLLLQDDRVWLASDPCYALYNLWEEFDRAYRRVSEKSYNKLYADKKTTWAGNVAGELLGQLLRGAVISYEQEYRDPPYEGDIDVLVQWPPFLLIVEVKARQMPIQGFHGDIGALKKALDQNYWEAEKQVRKREAFLRSRPVATFTDKRTKEQLTLSLADFPYIHRLIIPLHDLGGIAGRPQMGDTVPHRAKDGTRDHLWLLSLWMLEQFAGLAPDPHVFMHFITRRQAMLDAECPYLASEDLFFNMYLRTQLVEEVWTSTQGFLKAYNESNRFLGLRYQLYRAGQLDDPPKGKLVLPKALTQLYDTISSGPDSVHKRRGCHTILDWSTAAREYYVELLSKGLRRAAGQGDGDLVAVEEEIIAGTCMLLAILPEKQRGLLPSVLGFHAHCLLGSSPTLSEKSHLGVLLVGYTYDSTNRLTLRAAEYWHPDMVGVEQLLLHLETATELGVLTAGRNAPCPCGSGKKYKNCCDLRSKTVATWLQTHTYCRPWDTVQ
jgi:hypothetical protein